MEKELLEFIIEWDIENWSQALRYWEKQLVSKGKGLSCLELGGRKGGLSLWLALKGNNVICSDLKLPKKEASIIHHKFNCSDKIKYKEIDATNIPYQDEFDIVAFKSILGGISRNKKDEKKKEVIEEIYKALKPDGLLLFAENIESSFIHKVLRRRFVKWAKEWNYLKISEMSDLFSRFSTLNYITVGFFGTFGRNEKQRKLFGKLDRIIEKFIPKNKRYIIIGIAVK